jgi:hypothetical protein
VARSYLEDIPKSRFTSATLKRMYELVNRAKTDAAFQKLVYGIVNRKMPGQWKDYRGEVEAIFHWFKDNHDYRRDPFDVELLQDVWATMDRKRFDCDDASIWLGAACEILGAPARFVVVSTKPDREPEHVYVECFVGGQWTPLDASVRWSNAGWEPQDGITDRKVWDRRSVGLGTTDELPLEGLGMSMGNGHWEGGFARRMYRPEIGPEVSDDSRTFAHPMPGSAVFSRRESPPKMIAKLADQKPLTQPDDPGVPYPDELPISSHLTPDERYTSTPGPVPMFLDPNAWTGEIPTMDHDPSYYNPQPTVTAEDMVADLAGLGIDVRHLRRDQIEALRKEYLRCAEECRRKFHDEKLKLVRARQAEMTDLRAKYIARGVRAPAVAALSGHGDDYNLVGLGDLVGDIAAMAKNILGIGQASTLDQAVNIATSIYQQRQAEKLAIEKAKVEAEARARAYEAGVAPSTGMTKWIVPALVVGALVVAGKVLK